MNAEILCVGTELVLGDILNTNAQYLSKQLALKGINVYYQSSVGDNPERLVKSLSIAVARSNLIIFTGGLGPTVDDITVSTVANALGIELVKDNEAFRRIEEYYKRIGKIMTPNNKKQAYIPKGSVVFQNNKGTAPGCAIESGNQCIIFLPGPPNEMKAMFEESIVPYLEKYENGTIQSTFAHIYGLGESKIDDMSRDLLNGENPTVAPYAKEGETVLRVTAKAENKTAAQSMIDKTIDKIREKFGNMLYGFDDDTLQSVVVELLKSKNLTIATAESCTAGYISKRLTDVAGSSAVFVMGVTTYSNESKTNELSVPAELIKEKGAVSPEVAACMAKGIRIKSHADIGLSITGIAGPDSDGTNKPIGLSYIAISNKYGEYVIESRKGGANDREYIRFTSASEAINLVRLSLISENGIPEKATKYSAILVSDILKKEEVPFEKVEEKKIEITEDQPILEKEEPINKNKPKHILKATTVFAVPTEPEPIEDENIVSEKIPLKELGINNINKDSNIKSDFKAMIDSKEYTPVIEEETELEKQYLEQLKKDFGPKKKSTIGQRLFIKRGDSGKEKGRKITFWIALIVLLAALGNIGFYFINPLIQESKLNALADAYQTNKTTDYDSSKINPKFKSLYSKNNDIIGWISVDNTNINYPVLQNKDDEYYLRRGFDKAYSREGSIFADGTSSIEYGKETQNIMLYGHHMVSTGTMFKQLDKFLDLNFYKKSPTITFDTLYKDGTYKVFAVFITNAVKKQDNGNFYDYRKTTFKSDIEFTNWINEARTRSVIDTNIDVTTKDDILTLQTCNDSFGEGDDKARLIIMARKARNGETKSVNTSEAVANENPKYPQIWYDEHQLVNPFLNGATQVIPTSFSAKNKITTIKNTTAKSAVEAAVTQSTAAMNYVVNPKTQSANTTKKSSAVPQTKKTTEKNQKHTKTIRTTKANTQKTSVMETDPLTTDQFN